ncbi:MAG: phasin family protein [Oceanospirillaceae bacterium]|nr:phasin family protein [Oceanospirillaceae bacterium]
MYDTMMKSFADQMAPFTKVAEINKKTAEKLIALQSAYLTEMFNAGLAQVKALTAAEPQAAVEMQIAFYKEMESKLTTTAEQELAALTVAREELTSVFEESMANIAEVDFAAMMPTTEAKPKTTARKAAAPKAAAKAAE